jgi:hypothetical protein
MRVLTSICTRQNLNTRHTQTQNPDGRPKFWIETENVGAAVSHNAVPYKNMEFLWKFPWNFHGFLWKNSVKFMENMEFLWNFYRIFMELSE